MGILVEFLDVGGHSLSVEKFDADEILIGRDFDCELSLPDPYADPRHCRIQLRTGPSQFCVTDCNSRNGTRVGKRQLRAGDLDANSGVIITIGKTRLRLIDPALATLPALQLTRLDQFADGAGRTWVATCTMGAAALFAVGDSWVQSDASFQLSTALDTLVGVFAVIIVIAGFWGLIGRISRHKANIRAHASIAAAVWLTNGLASLLLDVLVFSFNGSAWYGPGAAILSGTIAVIGQFVHLSVATGLGMGLRLAIAGLMFLVTPGIALYKSFEDRNAFYPIANYQTRIFPPGWLFGGTTDANTFLEKARDTFREADREVAERTLRDSEEEREQHPEPPAPQG